MNKKLAELKVDKKVDKSEDYYDKIVKALENAGFILVFDMDTTTARYYIVAESEEEE